MQRILIVGLGGFLGTVGRYVLGGLVARARGNWVFPLETLAINVAGCIVIGVLAEWSSSRGALSSDARAFLIAGVLGGFTTFSAFGYESFALLRDGQAWSALWSIALHLILGVGAVWAGAAFVRGVSGG